MKRALGIFLIFAIGVFAYLQFAKPQPPVYAGTKNLSVKAINSDGFALQFTLLFDNKNNMRTQLGHLKLKSELNGTSLSIIDNTIETTISSKSQFEYPVELRFSKDEIPNFENSKDYNLKIEGEIASTTFLGNYSQKFEDIITFK
jgi:hypothetical protein